MEPQPECRRAGTYLEKYIRDTLRYFTEEYVESMPHESERGGGCFRVTSCIPKEIPTGGKVPVCFLVDTNGALLEITLMKRLNPVLDKAVLQMLHNMPPWNPGKKNNGVRVFNAGESNGNRATASPPSLR